MEARYRIWLARLLIGAVLMVNVQSAVVFLARPESFLAAFELSGNSGVAAIRGIAILFLMWNVPYVVALINPVVYRISLYEALLMQAIGVVGETLIRSSLPAEYTVLRDSIFRFILFDTGGLVALIIAAIVTISIRRGK